MSSSICPSSDWTRDGPGEPNGGNALIGQNLYLDDKSMITDGSNEHDSTKGTILPRQVYDGATECDVGEDASRRSWAARAVVTILALCPQVQGADTRTNQAQDVLRTTLDNGLKVVIVRNSLAPAVTTVVNYLVGSNEAPEGLPGTAHAQEHMMFRGSPGLTTSQLADIVAAMGGMFNADTQQTVTQYFFTVPADDLDVALHIELIRMRGVLDRERLWQQEKGAIEQEVAQDLSNPEYTFYTKLLAAMFKGTPYAHSPLGTVSSFDRTTGAMLKQFHETWYAPNNAILVVVGDVQPVQAMEQVRSLFGPLPRKTLPDRPKIELQPVKPATLHLKTDQPIGMAIVSFRMPGYQSEDYAASQVLADVLSSQRGDLYALVPQGKALYAGFSLSPLPEAGLGYAVAAFPQGTDAQPLLDEVRRRLAETVEKGFSADLVEAAKRQELTSSELQKNSVFGLAMAWSQAVAVEGRQSPADDLQAIQAVSVADVDRVARRCLDPNHAVVAILTPEVSGQPTTGKAFGGVENVTPKHTEAVKLPGWAQRALERLSVPKSTLDPTVTILPNGLRLIVQPTTTSRAVSVYGHVRNEPALETPPGKEGVNQVLDQMFNYGTTSLDRLAFQQALDEIGASESAGTDFSLDVLATRFDRGVQLLADNVLHPALPQEAFKIVQRQVAGTVAGQLQSPGYLATRALENGLYPEDDPSLREATPASVNALTLEDVREYHRTVFRPDLTTIVVVGQTVPETARTTIAKHFGSWVAEGPTPEVLLPPVPPNIPSVATVPDASRIQDQVVLSQTLGLVRSDPDYYALQLGNHVLGGGFYATRLYRDLREEPGFVYSVSASLDVNRTRGTYTIRYACGPSNVAKAREIVWRNLAQMRRQPVSDAELQNAKALLLREIPLSESSVNNIAQGFISRVDLSLPLNEPILAAKRYMDLTASQVQAAFEKWIRPDALVQIVQGPAPK
jgi:zinc protease